MPHIRTLFHLEAREKVLHGTARLADAVRVTLDPKSKSLIQEKRGVPIVCNDGVTIAKEIDLEDPEENLGAQTLRQAAQKNRNAVSVTGVLLPTKATKTDIPEPARQASPIEPWRVAH